MVKDFVRGFTTGSYIRAAIGAADPTDAFCMAAYVNLPTTGGTEGLINRESAGNLSAEKWNNLAIEEHLVSFPAEESTIKPIKERWVLLLAGKPAGSHKLAYSMFDFTAGTWTHGETAEAVVTSHLATPAKWQFGRSNSIQQFKGFYAAAVVWAKHLSDEAREALLAMDSVEDWLSTEPKALWLFNQAIDSIKVKDLTGGGADEIEHEKTSVVEAELPFALAPSWQEETWVDDDGSETVGTEFDAEHMNNIELGIAEGLADAAVATALGASGVSAAGVAIGLGGSGVAAAGSALVTAQQANARAASGVTAAGSALVSAQFAEAQAASGIAAAGSALVTGQAANVVGGSGLVAAINASGSAQAATGSAQAAQLSNSSLILVNIATAAGLATSALTGNVLEESANGTMAAIDGVTPVVGMRVLVKNEGEPKKHGVFEILSIGGAAAKWKMVRVAAMSTSAQVQPGMEVTVLQGTKNAATQWVLTTTGAIVLNTTSLTYALFSKTNPVNSTVEDLKIIRGVISSATPTIVKGSGFTIVRTGAGRITISFTAPFSDVPSVMFANVDAGHLTPIATKEHTASEAFPANISTTFEAVDGVFSFVAIGPR